MLGMEHGQVMIRGHLQQTAADLLRERGNLPRVEVMGGGHTRQSHIQEGICCKLVGDIQAEVPNERVRVASLQRADQTTRAHQNVTIQAQQEVHNALLLWLEDARRGNPCV